MKLPFICPQCRSTSLSFQAEGATCSQCGFWTAGSAGARLWAEVFSQPPGKTHICPACGNEALVDAGKIDGLKNPGLRFACFSCGRTWREGEITYCPECDQPAPSDELEELIICRSAVGFYVCKNCYEKIR